MPFLHPSKAIILFAAVLIIASTHGRYLDCLQVTTAREAMETMTDHHSRQAAIIKGEQRLQNCPPVKI